MEQKVKERLAQIFVDKYIKHGKAVAGEYAKRTVPLEDFDELRPVVRQEFRKRGYAFPSDEGGVA